MKSRSEDQVLLMGQVQQQEQTSKVDSSTSQEQIFPKLSTMLTVKIVTLCPHGSNLVTSVEKDSSSDKLKKVSTMVFVMVDFYTRLTGEMTQTVLLISAR